MGDPDHADLGRLSERLGYTFSDPQWLRLALTHASYRNERGAQADNERLEFLGDSLLGWAVAALLFGRFADAPEGELTRRRADLVSERGLVDIAQHIGLREALLLGRGEEMSGGRDKPRLLSSALEACLGAVYIDGGIDAAFDVVERLFGPRLSVAPPPGEHDYKSRVQELLQAGGRPSPRYRLMRTEGPDHDRTFFSSIECDGRTLGQGQGRSKVLAEQEAARVAFEHLSQTD